MWIPFLSGIRGRGRAEPRGGPRERGGQFAAPWCWVLVRGFRPRDSDLGRPCGSSRAVRVTSGPCCRGACCPGLHACDGAVPQQPGAWEPLPERVRGRRLSFRGPVLPLRGQSRQCVARWGGPRLRKISSVH